MAYWVFNYFYNRRRIANLHYGVKANELRKTLHIPIIDGYMKAQNKYNAFFGNRWESSRDLPTDMEALHVWKTVTPLTDSSGLDNEMDAYRKRYNDTLYYQMNIYSKIHGDSLVDRKGKLFFLNNNNLLDTDLNDYQIDSVSKSWELTYLIQKR